VNRWISLLGVLAVAAAGCANATAPLQDAGDTDPRCSEANCGILLDCDLFLEGQPFNTGCFQLASNAGVSRSINVKYCVEACQANDAGGLVECVAQFDAACLDAGTQFLEVAMNINALCSPDSGVPTATQQACNDQCLQNWEACSNPCADNLDAGVDACFSCAYSCSQTIVQCNSAC
jgi:hypothetical protein